MFLRKLTLPEITFISIPTIYIAALLILGTRHSTEAHPENTVQSEAPSARPAASESSVGRHLAWTQIDKLDEIAYALPDSARDWLTIECSNDEESRQFAREIQDIFSASQRVKSLNTRLAEPEANLRGIYVTVSGETDEHFRYAKLIAAALDSPERPVHFGPPEHPRPGIVKIIIQRAESVQPAVQARK